MKWYKESDLNLKGSFSNEIWIRKSENGFFECPMDIYLGKKTNLLTLKKDLIKSIKKQLKEFHESRTKLYNSDSKSDKIYVSNCPVTGISTDDAVPVLNVYGAEYVQTQETGHVYLKYIPSKKALHNFYLSDVNYAATYTDKENAEFRLNSIAVPWAEWTIKVYEKKYNKRPDKILDVGSGAGHFVAACRKMGIHADGIELSESSRIFAKKMWNLQLNGNNFEDVFQEYEGYDIVTFWGLLEHTPNPSTILSLAHKVVSKSQDGGMVIAKLPRWLSLSSAAQRLSPDTIIRHIDPMGHLMIFTDASAAELFYRNKFKPIAAWYYGMDIYEMLMQIGNSTDDYNPLLKTGDLQVELQQFLDENRFSDGLTLVGVPYE